MNQSALEDRMLGIIAEARAAGIDRDTILATLQTIIMVVEKDDDE